jgi:hypothetical protein
VAEREPFELVAGPEGMEGLILNFPVPGGGRPDEAKAVAADGAGEFKTWQCGPVRVCVRRGPLASRMKASNPVRRLGDVPETFGCPDCSATKADFEMIEL